MAVLNLYPADAVRYTRNVTTGVVTSTVLSSTSPMLQLVSTNNAVIRRKYPVDPWAGGTGWVREEQAKQMHGYGRQDIGSNQWIEAPARYWWSGSITLVDNPPDLNGLEMRLRAKIKEQNVNLAQALAEYRQTADLFSSAAKDIYKAFRSLRSGRALRDIASFVKQPRDRHERNIANRWLQYQYGVKPVISDLYGSAEQLAKVMKEGKWLYANVGQKFSLAGEQDYPSDQPVEKQVGFSSWRTKHDVRLRARYRISSSAVKTLAEVGITNPLNLAWELIPYSFVVDWMFPVGNWLSSLDALVGTTNFSYYSIVRTEARQEGTTYGGGWSTTLSRYTRNKYNDLPIPRLSYKPSDSLTKVLNGIALLRQLR